MRQSIGLSNADSSDGITNTTSPCVMLCFPPVADRPSFLVYFQQWYQKGFLVKPKKGHSNNTQGQWWEPASLPVIIHLFTELMTVAGGQELGASSHVMSPTHAKGLWGQAGDKKCGLYRKEKKNTQNNLYYFITQLLISADGVLINILTSGRNRRQHYQI